MIGVGLIRSVDIRLLDEELLFVPAERVPPGQLRAAVNLLSVRPRGQLRVRRHDAQELLVGENSLAQFFPAIVEQMQSADLVDPFLRRMMRRVRAARYVIDEPRLGGRELLQLLHVLDRLVGHGRGQVPAGIALEGEDRCRVAEQVRLPLARVAADEAVEVLEAHAGRPLVEGPGLAVREEWRVVVLAEPRGRIPVVFQDGADGALLDGDDRVVTGKPGCYFADHPKAHRMMVASGDERRPRRRAERGGVEVRVAQPALGDAIQGRGRDDSAEGPRRAEAVVVGHDQQHVGRALRRHNAGRPPRRRLRGLLLDHPAELRIGRRKLFSVDRGRRAGRSGCALDLLRFGGQRQRAGKTEQGDDDSSATIPSTHIPTHNACLIHIARERNGSLAWVATDGRGRSEMTAIQENPEMRRSSPRSRYITENVR